MALALPVSMRAVSVVLGILAAGCLSDPSAERSAGAPIINGTPTSGDPAVGRVALGNDTCTGTLVAPNVVLTAKHCFARGTQPSQVSFRTGSFGDEPGADVIAFTYKGPLDGRTSTQDIMALTLDHDLDLAPVAVRRDPMTSADRDATVRLVGYGVTDPSDRVDPMKREGTTRILQVSSEYFVTEGDVSNCWGDSGGPVFLGDQLVGVISGTYDQQCSRRGSHIRVDRNLGLIEQARGKSGGGQGDGGNGGRQLPGRPTGGGGDDSCAWANDGVCDEPEYCDAGTDATDCAAAREDGCSCDADCAAAGTCCDDCADDPASGDDPVVDEPAASDACDPDYCVADDGWCDEDLDCCDQDPDCEAAAEGDPAAPACLCDDVCDDYGDCCADCTGAPDAAADDPQCYCDDACVEWQDCCDVC